MVSGSQPRAVIPGGGRARGRGPRWKESGTFQGWEERQGGQQVEGRASGGGEGEMGLVGRWEVRIFRSLLWGASLLSLRNGGQGTGGPGEALIPEWWPGRW